ncbi:NADH-quinone oxidoreductase subunit J [Geoglobus acetivorans]|uniref:Uncharacterized protein n=1 Tax=Geoglobus acetivorans TaxID=565033 RepID=A0ABZ3H230_GEOAI|nr:NADH-quinone oxidoreductase subunit J [Geoglobus acetivorans]
MEAVIVLLLSVIALIFALGAWITRDNFYSALFMSATMLAVGAIYAFHGIYSVFVLIAFIFIGAVGIVTVALAATYRFVNPRKVDERWLVVGEVIAVILAVTVGLNTFMAGEFSDAFDKMLTDYSVLVAFLIVLTTLLMLSAISMLRRDSA